MEIYFSSEKFKEFCQLDRESYFDGRFGEVIKGKNGRHVHQKNGGKVLFVAHTDTVYASKLFSVVKIEDGDKHYRDTWYLTRMADDRLGCYLVLDYLKKFELVYDVLLTEGEEQGKSTAKDFDTEIGYNWLVEFDRAGADVVWYDHDGGIKKLLEGVGFKTGLGSWSDIGELKHLGVKSFNVGVGYYDAHGPWAGVCPRVTCAQVDLFLKFWNLYSETKLESEPEKYSGYYVQRYENGKWVKSELPNTPPPTKEPPAGSWKLMHKGYRWCEKCQAFVRREFWHKKKALCQWCAKGEKPKRYKCVKCDVVRDEGNFDPNGQCLTCHEGGLITNTVTEIKLCNFCGDEVDAAELEQDPIGRCLMCVAEGRKPEDRVYY